MMHNEIKVSIICNTYNHADYIGQALDSFLMQKTDFKFEILVHDDASTDNTADIIREYENKHPDIIRAICQTENQRSQKISVTRTHQIPRVRGEYTAFCEGDDYWTDPLKLQKQVDALEAHPDIDICAHAVDVVNFKTCDKIDTKAPSDKDCVFSVDEVIRGNGGFVGTNSLLYRSSIDKALPEFRSTCMLDYFLQIHGSLRGGMLYLSDAMAAYRSLAPNSWSDTANKDHNKMCNYLTKINNALRLLDRFTESRYKAAIDSVLDWQEFYVSALKMEFDKIRHPKYRAYYKALPFKYRALVRFRFIKRKLMSKLAHKKETGYDK